MMNIRRITTAVTLLLVLAACTQAAFMDPGFGARPMAMGGAFTAVSDDANAPSWNPAGMASVEGINANFMHSRLFTGLDGVNIWLNYASVVLPTDDVPRLGGYSVKDIGTFGIAWTSLVSRNLYREDTLILAYANRINRYIDAGGGIKYLGRGYTLDKYAEADPVFEDSSSAHTVTADIGMLIRPWGDPEEGLRVGISGQNLIPADTGIQKEDIVPAVFKIGAAYKMPPLRIFRKIDVSGAVAALDVSYRDQRWGETFGNKINIHFGLEGRFLEDSLALRCGANTADVSIGAGYVTDIEGIRTGFNYAFALPFRIRSTYGTHRLSLNTRF